MKKIMALCISGLIALCISVSLQAQSSQGELDQVELMKQFIGTWKAELGEDTTVTWDVTPNGKGYKESLNYQAKGETYTTTEGIIGYTLENRNVTRYVLFPNGMMVRLRGGFDSDSKMYWELYTVYENKVIASLTFEFITPDKIKVIYMNKGYEETWDNANGFEFTYLRVKK